MSQKKILLIDDEVDLVDLLQGRLEGAGYEVFVANSGEAGLKMAHEAKPDLILLDVMMPNLNGYQVCRELKKDEQTKRIPVMILTAKVQESDKYWGKECGADDYVTKPVDDEAFLARIAALLLKST